VTSLPRVVTRQWDMAESRTRNQEELTVTVPSQTDYYADGECFISASPGMGLRLLMLLIGNERSN